MRDLEAATFAEQYVRRWHAYVVEIDLGMSVRRVVVTEHGQMTYPLHALGIDIAVVRIERRDLEEDLASGDLDIAMDVALPASADIRRGDWVRNRWWCWRGETILE